MWCLGLVGVSLVCTPVSIWVQSAQFVCRGLIANGVVAWALDTVRTVLVRVSHCSVVTHRCVVFALRSCRGQSELRRYAQYGCGLVIRHWSTPFCPSHVVPLGVCRSRGQSCLCSLGSIVASLVVICHAVTWLFSSHGLSYGLR